MMEHLFNKNSILVFFLGCVICCQPKITENLQSFSALNGQVWLTKADQSVLFKLQKTGLRAPLDFRSPNDSTLLSIQINPEQTFQVIDGFGFTLTGGSALHIHQMNPAKRADLLRELFGQKENQIGISYLRVSIGASDLDEKPFSYNDLPTGEKDPNMERFSLEPDKKHLIPVLKEILQIFPELKIMGSPWSPPAWMKTNEDTRGGSLKPEYFGAYALYLVKYIQGMQAEGITMDAITIQNEPLHPGNNPSLFMPADEQAEFIKNYLGPAFEKEKIKTKIIIYDHNADRPDYPIAILNDPAAKKYVDGSAFHLYGGKISALSEVHEAHPDKHLYFTEQWIGAPGNFPEDLKWHVRELIIGATRNWCKTVLEWNLAADENQNPHTDRGGCDRCLGAVTIQGDAVTRNPAYYIVAHASKFVRPGSIRISSTYHKKLPNVAFKTPQGNFVLIVLNDSSDKQSFQVRINKQSVESELDAGAVGTYIW
ncbi:MAG: glycoside hydrolase family 30 beta sandwich domain-containing protein [Microscillaceae bacterium]|nr:glycoside hydrolase family 30 beta sandwich domain-containing protein [Microscillaceae bacterium]